MKLRSEMTDAEETAYSLGMEVEMLLEELSYVPPLEVAQALIENPCDYGDGEARVLARLIRERVSGSGIVRKQLEPPPVVKAKPSRTTKASQQKAASPDLFSG